MNGASFISLFNMYSVRNVFSFGGLQAEMDQVFSETNSHIYPFGD